LKQHLQQLTEEKEIFQYKIQILTASQDFANQKYEKQIQKQEKFQI
jgi:hypothetical protein